MFLEYMFLKYIFLKNNITKNNNISVETDFNAFNIVVNNEVMIFKFTHTKN